MCACVCLHTRARARVHRIISILFIVKQRIRYEIQVLSLKVEIFKACQGWNYDVVDDVGIQAVGYMSAVLPDLNSFMFLLSVTMFRYIMGLLPDISTHTT